MQRRPGANMRGRGAERLSLCAPKDRARGWRNSADLDAVCATDCITPQAATPDSSDLAEAKILQINLFRITSRRWRSRMLSPLRSMSPQAERGAFATNMMAVRRRNPRVLRSWRSRDCTRLSCIHRTRTERPEAIEPAETNPRTDPLPEIPQESVRWAAIRRRPPPQQRTAAAPASPPCAQAKTSLLSYREPYCSCVTPGSIPFPPPVTPSVAAGLSRPCPWAASAPSPESRVCIAAIAIKLEGARRA